MDKLSIMDTGSARIFVNTLAQQSKLRVVFSEEEITPYTDPKAMTIHVTRPRWNWSDSQHLNWLGQICHELGHHRGVNSALMQRAVKRRVNTKTFFGKVVNVLLDWINDAQWNDYPGAHRAVEHCQRVAAAKGIVLIKEKGIAKDKSTLHWIRIFSWIYKMRGDTYQPALAAAGIEYNKLVPSDELDKHNPLLLDLLDTEDYNKVHALAKLLTPEELQSPDDEGEDGEDGCEDGESEDSDKSDRNKSGKGKPKDGEEGEGESENGDWISYKDLLSHDHSASEDGNPSGTQIEYNHEWSDTYVPYDDYREAVFSRDARRK